VGAFAVQLAAAGAKSGSGGEAALQSGIK
jgi:hypothetical protein